MTSDEFFRAEKLCRESDFDAAAELLRGVVAASPEHVAAWRRLSEACAALGEADAAREANARANAVEADHLSEVGASLLFHGDGLRAQSCFERALELDANCLNAHWLMGELFSRRGETETALAHYRRCVEIAPDRSGPAYMIAALGGADMPDRAPDDYVAAFFDWYADHFDTHLTERLNYTGPEKVADALRAARRDKLGDVLDLGCGTGLSGLALADHCERLTGVDLSEAMLARAGQTGVYDELVQGEILDILMSRKPSTFDAAVAADVLVYIGALEALLGRVHEVLRAGGVFVASFEEADTGEDWQLGSAGRYRHAVPYLERTGLGAGFSNTTVRATSLREEYGEPVSSLLAVFEKG